jgi:hypothetical protein
MFEFSSCSPPPLWRPHLLLTPRRQQWNPSPTLHSLHPPRCRPPRDRKARDQEGVVIGGYSLGEGVGSARVYKENRLLAAHVGHG